MSEPAFEPLVFEEKAPAEMLAAAAAFHAAIRGRRTVRDFAPRPVARAVIEEALAAAGTAPSGANRQPWHFVAVADPAIKARIREAAEAEERAFYEHRASDEWLEALAPFGTNAEKPFLEVAPWLIAVFLKKFSEGQGGERLKNYYTAESVGIATGFLLCALHSAGLATLTHTPSPMKFLNEVLGRPAEERAYMLIVTGYPAAGAQVPKICKKPLAEIATFMA